MGTKIYLIVAESGAGKTSVAEALEKKYGLKSIQSYTTRPKRYENETGHIFISEDDFDKLTDLVAYTLFNNYRYCATSQQVEESDLYVVDAAGIDYFYTHYKGQKTPKIIYIYTTFEDRVKRMQKRGDTDSQILQRVVNDSQAFARIRDYADIVIKNDDLDQCVDKVYKYINEQEKTIW
jgi:guanylate kinase